jgi:hypothetical protein
MFAVSAPACLPTLPACSLAGLQIGCWLSHRCMFAAYRACLPACQRCLPAVWRVFESAVDFLTAACLPFAAPACLSPLPACSLAGRRATYPLQLRYQKDDALLLMEWQAWLGVIPRTVSDLIIREFYCQRLQSQCLTV